MSCINADTRDFWNALAKDLDKARPSAGRFIEVTGGRKHKGKRGHVIRHERSRFGDAYRYGNEASHHMRDMAGTYGWRCQIQSGTDRFWVDADKVAIVDEFCRGCGLIPGDCECRLFCVACALRPRDAGSLNCKVCNALEAALFGGVARAERVA